MQISIAFTKPKGLKIGSEFIQLFLNKPYSHVLVYWHAKNINRTLVYHAAKGKVHFIELNNFLQENLIIKQYNIEVTEEQYLKIVRKCVDLAGQKYSIKDLFVSGIYEICSRFKCIFKFKNHKGYICSELLAELLQEIYNKPFLKNLNLVTPADIDDFLEKHTN